MFFKDTVCTAQKTRSFLVLQTSQLMLCRYVIAVLRCMQNKMLCGQKIEFLNVRPGGV